MHQFLPILCIQIRIETARQHRKSSTFLQKVRLCCTHASLLKDCLIASLPGDTPVGFDLEDGGIICIVELDLWVPQLSSVDVHHDRGGAWGLSCRGHTHYLLVASPGGAGDDGKTG